MSTPHDPVVVQILNECLRIHKERHAQYGFCHDNFDSIAETATRLTHKHKVITALDIAVVMVATKEARYKFQCENGLDRHDSLVDWINYIAIMESMRNKEECEIRNNKHTKKSSEDEPKTEFDRGYAAAIEDMKGI